MTQRRSTASDTSELQEELEELLNISSDDISKAEVKELKQNLNELKAASAVRTRPEHRVNTEDTTPIQHPPRWPSLAKQEEMS